MGETHLINRRTLLAAASAFFATSSFAESYPSRPVTLLCPFSAGGAADAQMRALGAALSRQIKQTVINENRAGAAGTIGPSYLAHLSPDGYYLGMATSIALLRQPFIQPTRYDPAKDFTLYLGGVANSFRRTRWGQHGLHVRPRAWDVDVAPRLTFAPIRDRTVAKASPCAMSLH